MKKETEIGWKDFRITRPMDIQQLTASNAYVITKAACLTVLAFQKPVRSTIDLWWLNYQHKAFENVRCLYPHLAEAADFKSSINYINPDSLLGKLLIFIDRNNIFPFYQITKIKRRHRRRKMLNFELVD
jgi:hypothetical protein